MPGKSRRVKNRRPAQSRRKTEKKRQPVAAAGPVAQAVESVPAPARPVRAAPAERPVNVEPTNPFIARELWNIGIVATLMLVLLIILAVVIP